MKNAVGAYRKKIGFDVDVENVEVRAGPRRAPRAPPGCAAPVADASLSATPPPRGAPGGPEPAEQGDPAPGERQTRGGEAYNSSDHPPRRCRWVSLAPAAPSPTVTQLTPPGRPASAAGGDAPSGGC